MIPYSRQNVNEDDVQAVVEVLKSDFLTQGNRVTEFESAMSSYCHSKYAIATSSATAALHVACLSLELSAKDIVWVSAISFVASANCARYCGAQVDFVDVDSLTGLISIEALEHKLRSTTKIPKVLIVVHIAGQSCDMEVISGLCKRYNIRIIEDASHALGGVYNSQPVGSCRYSDITVFSFHPVKTITCGEGGMLMTSSSEISRRARLFACHGIERNENLFVNEKAGEWYYEQQLLGFNYRLSDIHAALGLSQLKRVNMMVAERAKIAQMYIESLKEVPVECLNVSSKSKSAWHLFVVRVKADQRASLFSFLRDHGFGVNLHYMPIPSQPYYQSLGLQSSRFPQAEAYGRSAISLPLFDGMNLEVVDQVVSTLKEFFKLKCENV